ncbi:uncharacterized protein LOC130897810 [Diorhabda carinulata]|uniref:uncharacterized protein LOC130897810 n=1 Tax=Diorhabda carinulata TaxID=1163345 RepID=UPI0025A062F9|nr:uncharacterized protein LOC130897810 [Diorhabda carinulata]XP_057662708.1 uncharacterized protein LOC130897810 [Diorhabda carinulata]
MEVQYQWTVLSVLFFGVVNAQEETVCYGPGSIAASVVLTFLLTLFVLWAVYFWRKRRKSKTDHLILETDPEKGKGEYAFDNPGFKDASYLTNKSLEAQEEKNKSKWNQWSPLSVLNVKEKSEKKKTLDDSALGEKEIKVISLRSEDFTGLGFNICGNMREGIYIKDVLHRGPAFDSGKLNSGDRINSVTINFEHMVYEDALAILSYASPYEVVIEAKGGKLIHNIPGQGGQPGHPLYKSSSHLDLYNVDKSSKKKIIDSGSLDSNYSSLKKSISNMTTLERKESHSPNINIPTKKQINNLNPEHLKVQLEQRMEMKDPIEHETQKTEAKFPKFGIRVLPNERQISPKSAEQNENNINIEKNLECKPSIDEVDNTKQPPPVKKREKKIERNEYFERNSMNNSGIRRDKEGIPLELPEHMLNAATAAMNNRKSINRELFNENDQRKKKGKAPLVPEDIKVTNYDDIQPATDDDNLKDVDIEEANTSPSISNKETKCYNSDSDAETDNNSSVNTIELNSSDITIHQTEEEEKLKNRKTASTGDLSKIKHSKCSNNTGTLERAQSLDITDSTVPIRNRISEDLMKSDEDLFRSEILSREPRLSLILDGLNTFQRNRLKKSTEWGNLEDAILKLDQEDEKFQNSFTDTENSEYHAVVNKINEIKRESETPNNLKQIKNEIWPDNGGFKENTNNIITIETMTDDIAENKDAETESSTFHQPLQKNIAINNRIYEPFESTTNKLNDILNNTAIPELNKRQRLPDVSAIPPDPISDVIDEWDSSFPDNITNTSPPHSLETEDITPLKYSPVPKPEEVLSKIPLLNSMVKNQKEEALKQSVLNSNITDETKTVVSLNALPVEFNLKEVTRNFLYTEQLNNEGENIYCPKAEDVNVSDDIKVSRHSYESLERQSPKYDNKPTDAIKHVSNINVTNSANGDSELHSLELSINESQDMYTTAVDYNDSKVILNTPDLIKNVTLTEAINTLNDEVTFTNNNPSSPSHYADSVSDDGKNQNASHTYVTEIKVTPNNYKKGNVSEIEITSDEPDESVEETRNLDKEFENYVKNFEAKLEHFESNIHQFDSNLQEFIKEEPVDVKLEEKVDENELQKIRKIAEQQLKKLPEMKFTTSSYEPSKIPEKRQSQVELLKSNFEKSSAKPPKPELPSKSRIPIATTKTPPTSPERRDSRNLENENDKAILELMSSSITSTPFATKIKPPNKNVTVTSIRTSSKIPSGLPTLGGTRTPRKIELNDENVVQVSTNGNVESSFKQWVFNPSNVTNVTVTQNKDDRK